MLEAKAGSRKYSLLSRSKNLYIFRGHTKEGTFSFRGCRISLKSLRSNTHHAEAITFAVFTDPGRLTDMP